MEARAASCLHLDMARQERQRARCGVWLVHLYAQLGKLEQLEEQCAALLEGEEEYGMEIQEETLLALVQSLVEAGYLHQARCSYEGACEQWSRKGLSGSEQLQQAISHLLAAGRKHRFPWLSLTSLFHSEWLEKGSMIQWTTRRTMGGLLEVEAREQQRVASGEEEVEEALQFGSQTARLVALVLQWDGGPLSMLEAQLTQEVQSMTLPQDEQENRLSRRSALLVLAGLPVGLLGRGAGKRVLAEAAMEAEVLPACAASLTACWQLLNGTDLALVEQTVRSYLPLLRQWATDAATSAVVREEVARLAAQGYLLLGFVAFHHLQFERRRVYDQEAVTLSRVAGDRTLLVKALTRLGGACFHLGRTEEMLAAYQEAAQLLDQVPLVLQGKVQMGLARAYAQEGNAREALESLERAKASCLDESGWSSLPAFLTADEGQHMLILFESFVWFALQKHERRREHLRAAEQALAQAEGLALKQAIPERARLGIHNQRALLAIQEGDVEAYTCSAILGFQGFQRFPSQMRRQEWMTHLKQALACWPQERRVRDLLDLLV
ncbi:tetratricopeptide repeat protein [Thermogemmatispora tikiterensis]|uniref:Uncharacterized protein n=1 Tax=Thermogemmatispora tikiterensis TaxID=1825093 RepID=A0A328VDR5_9CHLR|nr:hypothetical protein [Thermogemmatispora tikiterensis]RAQ95826.1 hypothetical protein A4R35_09785 [Thermogemmatispora tikiterensis]